MLDVASVEYLGVVIQQWMDDEWASLRSSIVNTIKVPTCPSYTESNKQRNTHIFNQENCPPTDLRSQVLHYDLRALYHIRILQHRVVVQRLFGGIILQGEFLTANVEL